MNFFKKLFGFQKNKEDDDIGNFMVATLNDKLGSRFMISGLDSKEEAERLVRELKNPFKGFENVKIILPKPNSKPIKSPAPTE